MAGPAAAETHDEGDGRLSANSGFGGFVVDAPVHHAYWASFGEWALCDTARDDGTPPDTITITGVRYVIGKHKPLEVRTYLRRVTPHQVKSHPKKPEGAYSPFIGLLGRPPHFDQRYANHKWTAPGHYTQEIAGTTVTRGCDETLTDAYADENGDIPKHAWTSLVLAVKTGRNDARIPRTLVDYTVGDTPHTLRIAWTVGGQGHRHHH